MHRTRTHGKLVVSLPYARTETVARVATRLDEAGQKLSVNEIIRTRGSVYIMAENESVYKIECLDGKTLSIKYMVRGQHMIMDEAREKGFDVDGEIIKNFRKMDLEVGKGLFVRNVKGADWTYVFTITSPIAEILFINGEDKRYDYKGAERKSRLMDKLRKEGMIKTVENIEVTHSPSRFECVWKQANRNRHLLR